MEQNRFLCFSEEIEGKENVYTQKVPFYICFSKP